MTARRRRFPMLVGLTLWLLSLAPGAHACIPGDEYCCISDALPGTCVDGPLWTCQSAAHDELPGGVDSNSPLEWQGPALRTLTSFTSCFPDVIRGRGSSLLQLGLDVAVDFNGQGGIEGSHLEATHRDANGTLYGWYHKDVTVCDGGQPCDPVTNPQCTSVPRIGAAYSTDDGATWTDLGTVIVAPADEPPQCQLTCDGFAGGYGDFSVIVDQDLEYIYFFFGSYRPSLDHQGIAVARMPYADRHNPVDKVWIWHDGPAGGAWSTPGLGGEEITPVFCVERNWHCAGNYCCVDAYWGPAVHWNSYLQKYVMVMNHAVSTISGYWLNDAIHVTFNTDISNPADWSQPRLIFEGDFKYPQIIGTNAAAHETDKLVGRFARLYLAGDSFWSLEFKEGEVPPAYTGCDSDPSFCAAPQDGCTCATTTPGYGCNKPCPDPLDSCTPVFLPDSEFCTCSSPP